MRAAPPTRSSTVARTRCRRSRRPRPTATNSSRSSPKERDRTIGLFRKTASTRSTERMAEITASMVKELREKTDAPMMECKKALTEADGDLGKAEEILRVKLGNKAS